MTSTPAIGALLALTGPEAPYARQLLHAIELARLDAGAPLRLRVADDHADPVQAVRAARELADDPDVVAVVGPMNSWTAETAAPVFATAGLPHVTPSASNPALTARGWATFFRACPADDRQGDALARVAADRLHAAAAAAVHDGSSFATPLAARYLARAAVLGLASHSPVAVDVDPDREVTAIAAWLHQWGTRAAVLVAGLEDPCRAIARALRAHGVTAALVGTDGLKPSRALFTPGHPGPWLTNSGTEAARLAPAFDARMRARAGSHDSIYTVEAYDAARLLLRLILEGAITREAMGAALRRASHDGLSGPLAFDDRGERRQAAIGLYEDDGEGPRYLGPAGDEGR